MKQLLCILLAIALCLSLVPEVIIANAASAEDLVYEISNGHVSITSCQDDARGELIIPDTIEGYPVTNICSGAFAHCKKITSITIPASVTDIGDHAFSWCTQLTGIWVAENNPAYKSDAQGVLFSADGTTLIQAPGAISGDYSIPAGVVTIGDYSFSGCENLTGVTIPEGVATIGNSAFSTCYLLTSVVLPESLASIGNWAFSECAFSSLRIPSGTGRIGLEAFYCCKNLKDVYFAGNAPVFDFCVFRDVRATLSYHTGTSGWENITSYSLTGYLDSITFLETDHQYLDGSCVLCGNQERIIQIGDINGDGKVNIADVSLLYAHSKGTGIITDEYLLMCADITGDGNINIADVSRVYATVKSS